MATDRRTVDYIVDQIAGAGSVTANAMFGEYGLYCDGKIIAIIGDERLFIKPTSGVAPWPTVRKRSHPTPGPSHVC